MPNISISVIVVNPKGEVIAKATEVESIVYANIGPFNSLKTNFRGNKILADLDVMVAFRKQIPVLQQKRKDLYNLQEIAK